MKKAKVYRRKFGKTIFLILKIVVIVVFLGGLVYVATQSGTFNISGVEIRGAKNFVSSADLTELANSRSVGKNILTFNKGELEKSLERDFQGAKEITTRRKLPSTLVINVTERTPLAVIKDLQDSYFLVDNDGYVLGKVDPSKTNLPKVNYEKNVSVGYVLEPDLVLVFLSLLKVLDDNKILVSDLTLTPRYLSFYTNGGEVEVLISNEKSREESVETLGNLLEKLSSEGKDPSLIDLRYDKVVVSYR